MTGVFERVVACAYCPATTAFHTRVPTPILPRPWRFRVLQVPTPCCPDHVLLCDLDDQEEADHAAA